MQRAGFSGSRGRLLAACGLLFAGCLGFFLIADGPAAAAGQGDKAGQAGLVSFDIPAQPLNAALTAYGAATGLQMLYNSALADGRRSEGVTGTLTPDAALRALLAGSGLVGHRTDIDAITIAPASPQRAAGATPAVVPDARFLGALQAGILEALCRRGETRPGSYRLALQLWISPDGAIRRAVLLGSTGSAGRDAALAGALQDLAIGMAPPAGMPQPVTMTIVPKALREGQECASR